MKAWGITDKGELRKFNQDYIYVGSTIYILADGMGGHNAGEIASKMAVENIKTYLQKELTEDLNESQVQKVITDGISCSNYYIKQYAMNHESCLGMGTTIVICVINKQKAIIANIGDSRAYLIRNNELRQITRDHSLVNEMVESGQISKEEAKNHPKRNFITRALGTDETVDIDFYIIDIEYQDILLLCSDGLSGVVEEEEILKTIIENTNYEDAVKELVKKANDLGGPDNISIIIVHENAGEVE